MKLWTIQKLKLTTSQTLSHLLRRIVIFWAMATVPLVAGVYWYFSNSIQKEVSTQRTYFEHFFADAFERQARFGDAVNAREYVQSVGSNSNLRKMFVCSQGKDIFGNFNSGDCPSDLKGYPVNIAGQNYDLKFDWEPQELQTRRLLSAVILVYFITLLGLLGLAVAVHRITASRIFSVAKEVSAASDADDLQKIGVSYPELNPVAIALSGLHQRLNESAQSIARLRTFEAVGRLSRQVAHDIRSPLSALNMVRAKAGSDADEVLKSAIDRINGIAQDLLDSNFAASTSSSANEVDDTFFKSVIELKGVEYSKVGLNLRLELSKPFRCRSAIPRESLFRILSNLINNSARAVRDLGQENSVRIKAVPGVGRLEIEIADNGSGMSRELVSQLSSGVIVSDGSGHGLGLSHARMEIQRVGGEMQIESDVGRGTSVHLSIPCNQY